jgi:hypothetical protein
LFTVQVVKYLKDALLFLKKEQFVLALSDGALQPSPLGIATTVSGIAPRDAPHILRPLLQARSKLILKGGLHPVFLVTPPSTAIEPDWKNYEAILHRLFQEQPDAAAVANYLGASPLMSFSVRVVSLRIQEVYKAVLNLLVLCF